MSLISRTSQYAIRAMAVLSIESGRMTVKELAEAVGAPQPYLARIIMTLASAGFIDARRGPRGGLKIGKNASEINLMEIIQCFDGNQLFEDCLLGLGRCKDGDKECVLHLEWEKVRGEIRTWWQNTSLDQYQDAEMIDMIETRLGYKGLLGGNGEHQHVEDDAIK